MKFRNTRAHKGLHANFRTAKKLKTSSVQGKVGPSSCGLPERGAIPETWLWTLPITRCLANSTSQMPVNRVYGLKNDRLPHDAIRL